MFSCVLDACKALQLVMGETAYLTKDRRTALQDFLQFKCGGNRQEFVDTLITLRGTGHTYARSDLARLLITAPWSTGDVIEAGLSAP